MKISDPIAAIATPSGQGAIGMIRLSGPDLLPMLNPLFPKKDLTKVKTHTLHVGLLQDKSGKVLDEVVLGIYKNPKSYTGEDVVEISCHGAPLILQQIMESLFEIGIKQADAGEFTQRAFLNGKLDLSQAEAVGDLIAAESMRAKEVALGQMRGGFSKKLKALRQKLLDFAGLIELELDFSEEDVTFADKAALEKLLHELTSNIKLMADSFKQGNVIKSGLKVVIAGRPNAGKSTLLNALLEEEKALVSDIPGTTRDFIEDAIQINGIQFRFTDTAGIRDATDSLEKMGIARTFEKLEGADLILYIFDLKQLNVDDLARDLAQMPEGKNCLVVGNKLDLVGEAERQKFEHFDTPIHMISGLAKTHLEALKEALLKEVDLNQLPADATLVTNIRHYQALQQSLQHIESLQTGLEQGLSGDFLAIDLRAALHSLGEITGEISNDDVLGNIFANFCIGK